MAQCRVYLIGNELILAEIGAARVFTGSKDSVARLEKKSRNRSVYRHIVVVGGCGKCKKVGTRLGTLRTEEVELDGPEGCVERY